MSADLDPEPRLPNFAWIRRGVLAAMALPAPEDWAEVHRRGIRAVLSLTERRPPGDPSAHGLERRHVPIEDFTAPTMEELDLCVGWIQEQVGSARPVVVHCHAGLGRTGTVVAAWLVAAGAGPGEAIEQVRRLRPGSLETREQVRAVHEFGRRLGREEAR